MAFVYIFQDLKNANGEIYMKKIIINLLIVIFETLMCFNPVYAFDNKHKFNDNDYQLISINQSTDSNYNTYIFKNIKKSYKNTQNNYEEIEYFIAEKPQTRNSVIEKISDISYALNASISYSYTTSGGYTRMNSVKVSDITVERGCTFKSVVVYLLNNGQGSKYLYTNQYKSSTFTTTSGGTIHGNSSWVPTTSVEQSVGQGTGILATFTIKRGTATVSSPQPWKRFF